MEASGLEPWALVLPERKGRSQDMRADVQGKPVYLGLAMNEQGLLKLKPQNLLLNLPVAAEV